jgi:hypothetical protein
MLTKSRFVYAYNMAKISNRNCNTAIDVTVNSDIGVPKLDIYIGYTEEILKLCARIAELPSLKDDALALRLSVATMYVLCLKVNIRRTNHYLPEMSPSSHGLILQLLI